MLLKYAVFFLLSAYEYYSTPTFSSVTAVAASPNSATVSVTVTGGVSMQIQASTDTSYSIHSPWFAVASSAVIGQLQAATTYNVRVVACDVSVTAFGSCSGNQGTSGTGTVTTNAAITSWQIGLNLGSTVGYNETQYPLNGRWMDGDTTSYAWLTDGSIPSQSNDGGGANGALGNFPSGRAIVLTTLNSAFTQFTTLNILGNGSSNGIGTSCKVNWPGWSDGSCIKSSGIRAEGNSMYIWAYRQEDTGTPYSQRYPWLMKSTDSGANWCYFPCASTNPNGDAPGPGDPALMWSTDALALPRFVMPGGQGGAVTNAVHGIDAYYYAIVRSSDNTAHYLIRAFKPLDIQAMASWEYYGGAAGGNVDLPANWSTDSTALTAVWDAGGGTPVFYGDTYVQYLADFGRFVMCTEVFLTSSLTDGSIRLAVWDSSSLTSFTLRYSEPTKPPFNSTNNVYLNRAWNQIFMPTYRRLTTNPPSASIQILSSGTVDQKFYSDPPNDMYSPWLADATIYGVRATLPSRVLIGAVR